MSNLAGYKDLMAFHPGYYVEEVIEDMGISQAEFALRLGTTGKTVSKLVHGQIRLSNDLAKKLSMMLGTSVDMWLSLQSTFDQKVLEIEQAKECAEQESIARQIDYSFFVKWIGLPETRKVSEKVSNLCKYFAVSNLQTLENPDFLVNFRTSVSNVEQKNIINAKAWLQTAINLSRSIQTEPYNAEKLESYLPALRAMTLQSPDVFIPRMKTIFAECGVAFVLLPYLANAGINGAVKWMTPDRAVLAMNNRGLTADKFWFAFFHEVKHVLQHKPATVFVNGSAAQMFDMDTAFEKEANEFAAGILIPQDKLAEFAPTKYTSDAEICAFASSIGIDPGIVAGRLQHEGVLPKDRCSKLKKKYTFEISPVGDVL